MIPLKIMLETWGGVGSAIVTFIFFWDMFRRYCPPELQRYLQKCTNRLSGFLNPYIQISIHEYTGSHLRPHEAYNIVEAYLSANSTDAKRLKAEMAKENDTRLMLDLEMHPLFESVEELIQEVEITPADVTESLTPKSAKEGPEQCLRNLICTLQEKKRKCTEVKETEIKDDDTM